jgi:hypothetical protein
MFDKWYKKEKPVFTGISRGIGGFSFGVPSAGGGGALNKGSGSASGATLSPLADGVASGDFKFFGFTAPGNFQVTGNPVYCDILVVGGGGGGAAAPNGNGAGGGGAGGVVLMPGIELAAGTYPVVVGTGGLGGNGSGGALDNDDNTRHGNPSTFGSSPSPTYVIAGGGGRGAQGVNGPNTNDEANGAGSGGGGAGPSPGPFREGYAGQIGDNPGTGRLVKEYANPGSRTAGTASSGGWGGGGGAGSMGNSCPPSGGGRGGAFTRINEFPGPVTSPLIPSPHRSAWQTGVGPLGCFGAGGGGGAWNNPGKSARSGYPENVPQGRGGTGAANPGGGSQGNKGLDYTGSGGGGSGPAPNSGWAGGDGGDGIVLIRQVVKTGFSFIDASGGDATDTRGGYKYHYFTNSSTPGTLTINSGKGMVEYFAVGGGGGGGGHNTNNQDGGGGGGAGGVLEGSIYCEPGSFTFTVGGGGAAGNKGGDTTLFGLSAFGGGRGSGGSGSLAQGGNGYGSGGGGAAANGTGPGGDSDILMGFRGGNAVSGSGPGGGGAGGGGAGGDGAGAVVSNDYGDTNDSDIASGPGSFAGPGGYGIVCGFPLPTAYGTTLPANQTRGDGYPSEFRGFAGGGGGGNWSPKPERGSGGTGNRAVNNIAGAPFYGGGAGDNHVSTGSAGVTNTGGGGGGGGNTGAPGGKSGGSGIIIVRYQVS